MTCAMDGLPVPPWLPYGEEQNGRELYISMRSSIIAGIFTVFFSFLCAKAYSDPSGLPEGKWVIAQMQKKNELINDFTVNLDINFYAYLMYFPVKAKLYFKRPDRVRMVFLNIPDFLRGCEKEFKAIIPSETMRKKYRCKVLAKETTEGKVHYVMKMSPLEEGNLKQVLMWVHSVDLIPEKMFLTYRDGSTIEVENEFISFEGIKIVKKQKISFKLRQLHARSINVYSNYSINKGIPDSIFEDKEEQKPKKTPSHNPENK